MANIDERLLAAQLADRQRQARLADAGEADRERRAVNQGDKTEKY